MVLAIPRFTKEKRAPISPQPATFYLMLLLATGFGAGYSGKWFVEGSGTGGGGRSGGWLIGGGGFWSSGAAPTNVSVAIAVTAMAGLALAVTIVYSRRGGLKSPWSRRRRKHALLAKQWISLFLPDGKLSDGGVKFLKKVRSGGVDPAIRAEVWPFLLGVYDLNSSTEEREAVKKHNRKQYEILRKQCKQITRRTEKGPGSKENSGGCSSELSGEISHGNELSGEIISHGRGGGYNSDFSGEISQVLDPIMESSVTDSREDSPLNLKQDSSDSVSQHPKEESFESEDSVPRNLMAGKDSVCSNGSTSNSHKDVNSREVLSKENLMEESESVSQNPKEGSFQREDSVPRNLMHEKDKLSLNGSTSNSRDSLSKENLVEASGSASKNIDSGVLNEPTEIEGDGSLETEIEGDGSLEKSSDAETESTISDSSESDELEYSPPLFSSSELEPTDPDGTLNLPPSEPEPTPKKSHSVEDFATWQRIIRLDAVRANDEWIIYSPSQASVTQMKARRLARSVGLKDFDNLDSCRVFHAARLVGILEAYAVYDPEIGYCQGMSDLLSPIVSVIEEDDVAFWCFVGFMKKARHNFRLDEVGIRRQLNLVSKIIKCKDSHLYSHLEQLQAEDCFFVYRMVVVLFRRELDFDQTLCLWEVIWADQAAIRAGIARSAWRKMRVRAPPSDDLLLFAIAACVLQRRKLIIEKYSSMEEIMRECNSMAGQLDVWKLLDDAHDLVVTLHDKV